MKSIYIVLLIGLLVCSWEDIRSHTVSLPLVIGCSGILCSIRILHKNISVIMISAYIFTIGITWFLSRLSEGGIGLGDGFLLAMAVLGLGRRSIQMFAYCFAGTFVLAMILLVVFSRKKDTRIPLAPFILGGSLLAVL